MNADIQSKLDAIKAPFQSVIEATDALPALVDAAEQAKFDEGYLKGLAEGEVTGIEKGKGMIQLPDATDPTVQYTQAQLNEAVTAGKEQQKLEDQVQIDALNAQITEKDTKISNLENQVAQFNAEQIKADAVAAFKAELKAKYEEQQVAETAGETGFLGFLS
jgi:hypothetical protein